MTNFPNIDKIGSDIKFLEKNLIPFLENISDDIDPKSISIYLLIISKGIEKQINEKDFSELLFKLFTEEDLI